MLVPRSRLLIRCAATAGVLAVAGGVLPGARTSDPPAAGPGRAAVARPPAPMSEAEIGELEVLLQDLSGSLGPGYAGAALDERAATVQVGVTAGGRSRLDPAIAGHPRVRVVERRFSLADLDAAMEAVSTRLGGLLGVTADGGRFAVAVDVRTNAVVVELDPSQRGRRAEVDAALAELLTSGVARVAGYRAVDERKVCARSDCHTGSLRGGLEIYEVAGTGPYTLCTSGFVMRDWRGVTHLSTAGHCGGGAWQHAFQRIGRTVWSRDAGNVDAKVMTIDNVYWRRTDNLVYRDGDPSSRITLKQAAPGPNLIGALLCVETRRGSKCGKLTSHNASYGSFGGFGRLDGDEVCPGDSGAPVVNRTTNRAYGILSATDPGIFGKCGSASYFTWITAFEAASGYQLLTTAFPPSLGPGQKLAPGQSLRSQDGRFELVMQVDGNLVLYHLGVGHIWATSYYPGFQFTANTRAEMQGDGNLVLYTPYNWPRWASSWYGMSAFVGGTWLNVQDDGNLVMRSPTNRPVWASGTCCR